jgi:integrase
MATGITKRHSGHCRSRDRGRCNCDAGWEASVYSRRDGKKIRKTFAHEAEAKTWRVDSLSALSKGSLRAPTKTTIRQAGDSLIAGMESGEVPDRSGHRFKPKTIRGYRQALEDRIYPNIGPARLSLVTTADLQALIDRWHAAGLSASTIRNTIKPLQVIYRRARAREGLPVNPTRDLELPALQVREVEIVPPHVAARLLAVLADEDRAVWATALYAGLRYGELQGLRWHAVSLADGLIYVRESWDAQAGRIAPKTPKSRRRVPIPATLRDVLLEHRLGGGNGELVFAKDGKPFQATSLYRRADRAWENAGLTERLRLHRARHTYASFMIAAGVNAKALATFMGHSSIKVTYDLYGHLMPGTEAEAAALLNVYLDAQMERAEEQARAGGERLPV